MLGLFLLCAMLPITLLSVFGYYYLASVLENRAREDLRGQSKVTGMILLDRLAGLSAALGMLTATEPAHLGASRPPEEQSDGIPAPRFQTIFLERPDGRLEPILGEVAAPPSLGRAQLSQLQTGGVVLLARPGSRGVEVFMVRATERDGRVWGLIEPNSVWGAGPERSPTAPGLVPCIVTAELEPLSCPMPEALAALRAQDSASLLHWNGNSGSYIGVAWSVFLGRGYAAPSWKVVLGASEQDIFAPLAALRWTFLLGLTLALAGVFGLSHVHLRRTMQPLEALEAGTRRLAAGDFSEPVMVRSNDEFQALAGSFNQMTGDLERQFRYNAQLVEQLDALSWGALTTLAKTIDAVSPWTAGHSERVTLSAMEIGRHLGVSEQDMDLLHRGGLLHDIGKVGLPPGILDKPAQLTEEELAAVREHPAIGARILAPIVAFEAALPLVLHHHEMLDGSGYPHGLRGDQIPRLVRILSVADVFDALVSDRPYRAAWPLTRALEHMREGAGIRFDAEVVEALSALVACGSLPCAGGVSLVHSPKLGRLDEPSRSRLPGTLNSALPAAS